LEANVFSSLGCFFPMANFFGTFFNDAIGPFSVSFGVIGVPTSGADYLDGGFGADTMDGGDGSDTYVVDNIGDIVKEVYDDFLGGVDTVFSSVTYSLSPGTAGSKGFGIENLTLPEAPASTRPAMPRAMCSLETLATIPLAETWQ
jgi:hypothetical protein